MLVASDKSLVIILLCAVLATFFLIDMNNDSVPPSPLLPSDSVGFAAHSLSSSFSAAESGVSVVGSQLSVSDFIVYRTGWYSINGSSWVPFNLSGSSYNTNGNWLRSHGSRALPTLGVGEHYVLVYSCARANNVWNCHDNKFQLIVINNTGSSGGSSGGSGGGSVRDSDIIASIVFNGGPEPDSECGDALDYQCGFRTICGRNVNYGNCPTGYDCNGNLCIASDSLTCDGVSCGSGEYCSHGVCLLDVPGNTYFVATWGNDSWPGNFTHPFYNWQRVVGELRPGDIAYFRGGLWQPSERPEGSRIFGLSICGPESYNTAVSGTAQAPIRYFNYPGEKPILDGQFIEPDQHRWSSGISLELVEHIHLRGLTVRHIHQSPPDFTHEKPYSEVYGIGSSGANIRYENMVAHDIDGRGFQHWSYAWGVLDMTSPEDVILFESDSTSWINCDAYNLFDRYSPEPGNAADGWKVHGYYGNNLYWEGCRAFNYADDGFDPSGTAYRTFKNCWAMSTDKYQGLSEEWDIEGNGFKMTGTSVRYVPDYVMGKSHFVRMENSIAADCVGVGFYNNILVDYDANGDWPNGGILYNNLAYRNDIGFSDANASIYRNNIVYDTQGIEATGEKYEVYLYETWINESNNTWIATNHIDYDWWWKYNPAFNVTDDDFVSLNTSQLIRPRKIDGSLPDITFGHLVQGSDLIDKGMDVGLPFKGNYPDLGPFESDYTNPVSLSCSGSGSRSCNISNGNGTQTMTCNTTSGNWGAPYGNCILTSCNPTYFINGSVCSPISCSGSNNRSCNILNGTGIQFRTCNITSGNWSSYGTCTVSSCSIGYTQCGNRCNLTSRTCPITYGVGNQSGYCSNNVWLWNACTVQSCNSGYTKSGNTCVAYTPPVTTGAIVADHNAARNFDNIPACWLDRARQNVRVIYHHTSHGSQIPSGMDYLVSRVNSSRYAYNSFFLDRYDTDVGNGNWPTITRSDLSTDPTINTIMWSWCGQASGYTTYSAMSSHYLAPAESIIDDYGIDYIYMTGHLEGSGPTGALYQANNIIRQHVADTGGILFDFADIESYDPAGNYYPSGSDACEWCTSWCTTHPSDCKNLPGCAHSHGLNCVQKARAYWWLLARMAGWDGVSTTCN